MTTSNTPLGDVLKASLREEFIHTCNALGLILGEIDATVLEHQIRAACTASHDGGSAGRAVCQHFSAALRKPWPGVSEGLTRAAWHVIEAEPAPVVEVFDCIVYEMFVDPEADVALVRQ